MTTDLIALAERVEAATGADRAILDRLDRTGDCWLWTGALDERGRGRVWHNGKIKLHHRAIWEILIGPIPSGALLCHDCDNPTCGNPAHLYVGDGKTNVRDMFARGRAWHQNHPEKLKEVGRKTGLKNTWVKGAANPRAKLTQRQVAEIREATESSPKLAAFYGVSATTVQRIRSGKQWN